MDPTRPHAGGLTIISGADHPFFRCLYQFLCSVIRHNIHQENRILLYDLGLDPKQRLVLHQRFLTHPHIELRSFPFERYPPFVNVRAGTYAWKPVIISDVLEELQKPVLWLDSATIITGSLYPVRLHLERFGCYVPVSGSGTLQEWILPQTLAYMKAAPELLNERNRAGSVCGFNYHDPVIRQLVKQWRELALVEECIAPEGGHRRNHRYDQAILTILLYQYDALHNLHMTTDEIDISSTRPVPFLSVRNKVPGGVPLYLDALVRRYFMWKRRIDILILNIRVLLRR